MVTGRLPFTGETQESIVRAVLHGTPPRPSKLTPNLPLELHANVGKCLSKDRYSRYRNSSEIRTDLLLVTGESPATPIHSDRNIRPRRGLFASLVAAAAIVTASIGAYTYLHRTPGKLTEKDT